MAFKLFRLPAREELSAKLTNHPVLNALVCLLLYERWFRIVLALGLILVPSLILSVLKIWRTTPADFRPVIRISMLDKFQAWSLRRTAIREAAAGRFDDAFYSWRVAVGNDPGNPDLVRACLEHLGQRNDGRKYGHSVISYSSWLLRLTQTNLTDLERVIKVLEPYRMHDLAAYWLAPMEDRLTPALEAAYLKTLFHRGEMARFEARWEGAAQRGTRFQDPDLALYHAAFVAGWGAHAAAPDARQRLQAAQESGSQRVLAHRLQLRLSERLVQPESYRVSLEYLQDQRQDTLAEHAAYWELLASVGRKDEAVQRLRAHVQPPASGHEAVLLARAFFTLGFPDEARNVLQQYTREFSDSESIWLTHANLLIDQRRWDDLFTLAVQMRQETNPLRDPLDGYSHYLQGMAEARRNRPDTAREAFQKIIQARIRNKLWELGAAETIDQLGFSEIAREMLLDMQKDVPQTPEYWILLARTAFETRDPQLLVSAMASAYKLRPNDFEIVHNYAAALLSTRQRPEEALRLTERILQQSPGLPASRINHAIALLQNQRTAEAEAVLTQLDPGKLSDPELTAFHLASLELELGSRRLDRAREHLGKIDLQYLLPPERDWLAKARVEIESGRDNEGRTPP